jgi:hypothetical protein
MKTEIENLKNQLEEAIHELDHNKVSWIDKHLVIDLNQKGQVLLTSLLRFDEATNKQGAVIEAVNEYLITVTPVIKMINKD